MSLHPVSSSPPILPAPAILASALLLANTSTQHPNRKSVGTGCKQVDEILDGGFRYGEITGLAIASPSGAAGDAEGGGYGVGSVGRSVSCVVFPEVLVVFFG